MKSYPLHLASKSVPIKTQALLNPTQQVVWVCGHGWPTGIVGTSSEAKSAKSVLVCLSSSP